jgi:hypothetical protein
MAIDDDSRGDTERATLECALAANPRDAALHRAMAAVLRAQGDELGTVAHMTAGDTPADRPTQRPKRFCESRPVTS